jgi:hypothetical protein
VADAGRTEYGAHRFKRAPNVPALQKGNN